MSGISTHVLDLTQGKPAVGIPVRLEVFNSGVWQIVVEKTTDTGGRCRELLPVEAVTADTYRLIFATRAYFASSNTKLLYPEIILTFQAAEAGTSYHMPLLLSPNGYTTYKGS